MVGGTPYTLQARWTENSTVISPTSVYLSMDYLSRRQDIAWRCANGKLTTIKHEKADKRPRIVEEYFQHCRAVIVHDHLHQRTLAFHRSWKTLNWCHRLFIAVLGMIITDAYLAYRFESISSGNPQNASQNLLKSSEKNWSRHQHRHR